MGTPGRLLDHAGRETLRLTNIEYIILDEADQMLDMGFKEEMEKVSTWYIYAHTASKSVKGCTLGDTGLFLCEYLFVSLWKRSKLLI